MLSALRQFTQTWKSLAVRAGLRNKGAMAELENLRDAAFSVHAASAEMADLL
jgi:hypothetical protein